MDHEKKLKFVHQMAKLGLDHIQHMDGGGVISAGNSNPLSGIAGALTAQNSFSATAPDMNTVTGNQDQLANQLRLEAAGGGPNPAQAQYLQNAQKISQNQASLNASNRALNPGLAARMSGNQAVEANQNAASGAAIQQAQQQLAAQGQLSNLYAQQQNASGNAQGINAQVSQNNTNAVENTQGGILKSLPLVGGLFGGYRGGKITGDMPHFSSGGSVHVSGVPDFSNASNLPDFSKTDPKDSEPKPSDPFSEMAPQSVDISSHAQDILGIQGGGAAGGVDFGEIAGASKLAGAAALNKGGSVKKMAEGGPVSFAGQWLNMSGGGDVKASAPDQKAVMNKDSLKNDKIPAMLSEGELVIDKDTMNDQGPMGQMARVLAKHIQSRNGKKK